MGELIVTALALWRDRRALLTFYSVFLALWAVVFLFLAIGLGTWAQVLLSFALPFVAGWLFFILQALCLSYDGRGAWAEWLRGAAWESGKLCLVSLPLFVVGWLLAGVGDAWWVTAWRVLFFAFVLPLTAVHLWMAARRVVVSLPLFVVGWLLAGAGAAWWVTGGRALFFAFVLLTAVHLWMAARRVGVWGAWRELPAVLARAFAPATLIIYTAGLAVFGLAPYLLSWARLPSSAGRLQIAWFVLRAGLALALALFAWVVTVITLAARGARRSEGVRG